MCILILVPTIMLAVTLSSSNISQTKFKNYWTFGAVLAIVGTVLSFIGIPIFPILVLTTMYVIIFPFLTQTDRILMMVSSVMLLVGILSLLSMLIVKGNLDDIIFTASWCLIMLIILVSHSMLFYGNHKARKALDSEDFDIKFKLEETPESIAESLYHGKVPVPEEKGTPEVQPGSQGQEIPLEEEGKPIVHMKTEGPRELRPPPGFALPVDDD